MSWRPFPATKAALERFDRVDEPALHDRRDLRPLVEARRAAADRVRAAYLRDTPDVSTPENVELMSVDEIRSIVRGTPLGRLLGMLP